MLEEGEIPEGSMRWERPLAQTGRVSPDAPNGYASHSRFCIMLKFVFTLGLESLLY